MSDSISAFELNNYARPDPPADAEALDRGGDPVVTRAMLSRSSPVAYANGAPAVTAPTLADMASSISFASAAAIHAAPQLLDADVSFLAPADYAPGGTLTVSGLASYDQIKVIGDGDGAGQIAVSGNTIRYGGVAIGTFAGGDGADFTVSLNASASADAIDTLIEHLGYQLGAGFASDHALHLELVDANGVAAVQPSVWQPVDRAPANPFAGLDLGNAVRISVGDLDGDGDVDVVSASASGYVLHTFDEPFDNEPGDTLTITVIDGVLYWTNIDRPDPSIRIHLNNGDGTFSEAAAPKPLKELVDRPSISLADADGDGDLDLFMTSPNQGASGSQIYLSTNDGHGNFSYGGAVSPSLFSGNVNLPNTLVAGDVDGRGGTEVLLATDGSLDTFHATGNGWTNHDTAIRAELDVDSTGSMALVDSDRDGDLDLVEWGGGGLRYWENTDGTSFAERFGSANPFSFISSDKAGAPAFADLDGDGDQDLMILRDGAITTYWNNAVPGYAYAATGANITLIFPAFPANAAPAGTDATITIAEDTRHVFTTGEFGFTDPDGNALAGITIATLPAAGILEFDADGAGSGFAVAVIAGQLITADDVAAGKLSFVPAANANGAGYASFTFQVHDDGGIANGGADSDASPNVITVNVTPVDDAAMPADDSASTTESAATTIAVLANDFDIDGSPPPVAKIAGVSAAVGAAITLASGAHVTLNANGTLTYDPGTAFSWLLSGATAAQAHAWNTEAMDSFTYALADGSSATVRVTVTGLDLAAGLLAGTVAADTINGTAGNDRFDGGPGADRMVGGLGDDLYYVDSPGDIAQERAGEGFDTVYSAISYSLAGQFIEELRLTGSALTATGNGIDNVLVGNALNNTLDGGAGNDRLDGGSGADLMTGGLGDDVFYVDQLGDLAIERANEGHDTVYASIGYSLAGQYVEDLVLTGHAAINGTGNKFANALTGNDAANLLDGGDGNDVIDGGGGVDTMIGGLGDDRFYVGQAGDLAVEQNGQGTDTVYSMISYSLAGQFIENLVLAGHDAINATGNKLANILTGNDAGNLIDGGEGNDLIDGGGGADQMTGGLGNDSFHVDQIGDLAVERANEGYDTIYASVSYSLAGQYVEALMLTGGADIDATGNKFANLLVGNGGANQLHGGLGADTLTGGDGADGFWFDTAPGGGNVDTILDFSVAEDRIHLDGAIFGALASNGTLDPSLFAYGTAAQDADDRIVYDAVTGRIYYDEDGSGDTAAVLFAQVTPGTALTSGDFLIHL